MLNVSLNELRLIAKSRGIKDYKRMSEDRLLSVLNASEPITKNKTIKEKLFRNRRSLLFKPIKTIKKESNTDKILESIRKLYRLEKNVLEDIRNLFKLGKITDRG